MGLAALLVVLVLSCATASECPVGCQCLFREGKEMANCSHADFTAIPQMPRNPKILSFGNNLLVSLPAMAFKQVQLENLHKVQLQNNRIENVDRNALAGMGVLIEINLTGNKISFLDAAVFRPCPKIREVILQNNPLRTLSPGLFSSLAFLQKVMLSDCLLESISQQTFENVPLLTTIDLRGNRLTTLDLQAVQHIPKLKDLGLTNNPWNCDCRLRPLRDWVVQTQMYTHPTMCSEDQGVWLSQGVVKKAEAHFACVPEVVDAVLDSSFLGCLVKGDPEPKVQWYFNGKPINSNHSYTGADYILNNRNSWFNLTVRHARSRDSGEYKCVAVNAAGKSSRALDVRFSAEDDVEPYGSASTVFEVWPLIVGVVVGALFLLAVVLLMCCCLCRRNANNKPVKGDGNGVSRESEEKTLMTSVNPVTKPPRRQETALNTSETELLECSLPYNETGSILGTSLLDGQTTPAGTLARIRSHDSSNDPPDLLAFSGQSPASLASPIRLPAGQFGTLPYARSHSPFSPPIPVVSRTSGYVTIPRRPRVPSWTASLSPVLVSPDEPYAEPVYDNLGPRTTLDGSSVLSLNKMDGSLPTYRTRPLPLTPYERQSWARSTPDGGDEREMLIAASPTAAILPKKVPPSVPPKPKKKAVFQDEGVDGTEV